MQDWPRRGTGPAAETETDGAEDERDPAGTIPDPQDRPAAADDTADWDELTSAESHQVPPQTDVLVAGRPIGTPAPSGPAYGGGPAERPATSSPATSSAASDAPSAAQPAESATESGPAPAMSASPSGPAHGGGETVIDSEAADAFHARWRDVQFGFVDDPREAVRQADEMADEVVRSFTDALEAHKRALEDRWRSQRDAPPDTERLRLIVRAYREFVDRLLNA